MVIILVACGSDASTDQPAVTQPGPIVAESTQAPGTAEPQEPAESGSDADAVIGEIPDELRRTLVADALERTGGPEDGIAVVLAEAVTWNDGSLGCPQPGTSYTQALVEGYRVVLSTPAGTLDYRTSGTDFFVVCQPIGSATTLGSADS